MTNLANQIERLSEDATPGHWGTVEGLHLAQEYADKTRAELTKGELSDLHLANRMYLAGREDLDLIVWQTAAKERIRWLSVQLALALNAQAEVEALRKQLPKEMQDCTIVFEECEKGHGHLRGTNWIKHPCQQCEVEALRARVDELEQLAFQYRSDLLRPPVGESRDRRLEAIAKALGETK